MHQMRLRPSKASRFVTPLNVLLSAVLLIGITFSIVRFVLATTPNPGHAFSDLDLNQVTKTGNATLTATETVVLADATSGAITLTLPAASATTPKQVYFIKKIDAALANLVTIDPNASETIDGLLTIQLAQRGESVTLQSDGTNWRTLQRRDFDISAYRTKGSTLNQWYTAEVTGTALTTGAPAANTLFAIPFVISKITTIDQMAINVTTLGTGSTPRIGIYADNGNLYPGALVVDAGTQSGATTGVKTYTTGLPVTLDPGMYWLAYVTNATAPTIRTFAVASLVPILGYPSALGTAPNLGWSVAFTFGALPSTFTGGAAGVTAVPIPSVFVRTSQ
ncbi:MAG: hypothetical protein QOE22_465 [Candidatus Parcubacteria bacterium]|jgi:hypothetical protein|nr:hypothetical protein [Candidatus Parcubacteria bacterium]